MVRAKELRPDRIYYLQVPLLGEHVLELLERAGTDIKSEALQVAVEHFLKCPMVGKDELREQSLQASEETPAGDD